MTFDEKLAIDMQTIALDDAGKHEEAEKLALTKPLSPAMAMVWKRRLGAESLKQSGWNLAEAEAKFGPNWLND
jgi:hypothetical protein